MAHALYHSASLHRSWSVRSLIAIQRLCFTSNSESSVLNGFAGGGIILGNHGKRLTPALSYIDQTYLSGSVLDNLTNYKLFQRIRDTEIFYSTFEQKQFAVAVSPLPVTSCENLRVSPDEVENPMDVVSRNSVRRCIGMSVQALQRRGTREILVDPCGDAEVAAEGAYLAAFVYDELKSIARQTIKPHITCYTNHLASSSSGASVKEDMLAAWERGRILAMSQNLARKWMEMPANYLPPSAFAQHVASVFDGMSQVRTNIRSSEWCREHRMNGLLSVGAGSRRHVAFVEIVYEGNPARCKDHVALVGKGVTFDSGGISLKRSTGMEEMRADMGGAAVVASTVFGLASFGAPINVRAYLPLCENMPGGGAMRPGDVIRMANGLTVQVDNTDAEGRLILADALHIACKHPDFVGEEPSLIIDVATLTGAISAALGDEFTGVFSNHAASRKATATIWQSTKAPSSPLATETEEEDVEPIEDTEDEEDVEVGLQIEQPLMRLSAGRGPTLWDCLRTSATIRGDRVWNLPLLSTIPLCEQAHLADLMNVAGVSNAKKGGSGTAAAFLNFFVPKHIPWMHLDIAGVMKPDLRQGYMRKGMAGRPTRTLIEFLQRLSRI